MLLWLCCFCGQVAAQVILLVDRGPEASATDALYLSGPTVTAELDLRPPGLNMTFIGDGVWQLTIDGLIANTTYQYKFRNGYWPSYAGEGWEA